MRQADTVFRKANLVHSHQANQTYRPRVSEISDGGGPHSSDALSTTKLPRLPPLELLPAALVI